MNLGIGILPTPTSPVPDIPSEVSVDVKHHETKKNESFRLYYSLYFIAAHLNAEIVLVVHSRHITLEENWGGGRGKLNELEIKNKNKKG